MFVQPSYIVLNLLEKLFSKEAFQRNYRSSLTQCERTEYLFKTRMEETGGSEHKYFDLFIVTKSKHHESKEFGVEIPLVMREHSEAISLRVIT